jgi:alpha-L-rhamnosidase
MYPEHFDSRAGWIEAPWRGGPRTASPPPLFRKVFRIDATPARATLRWTCLGVGEARLDGSLLAEAVLFPGWTDYRQRVRYAETDVTARLTPGEHCLEILVGDGWACGHVATKGRQNYALRPALLAQLEWESVDGRRGGIHSGTDWQTAFTPILASDLLMGESYDARLEGAAAVYFPALPAEGPAPARVELNRDPVVRRKERFPAHRITPRGRCRELYDLGQNIAGRLRIKVRGKAGVTLRIRHGEMLDADGALYTANLRGALATDHYTLSGNGIEEWEPAFTFHGFRYATFDWEGEAADCELLEVEGIALYSDLPETGAFSCSHAGLNQLFRNIVWGQKGNFLDIPTDCPQRDERLGWTGDAQVFAPTAAFNMHVLPFFRKWLRDLREAQRDSGLVPPVAPDLGAFGLKGDGGPAWADALVLIPWYLYEAYGEAAVLEENYRAGCRYMAYLAREKVKDAIRCHPDLSGGDYFSGGFGDWLALDGSSDNRGLTPADLIGTAFYARDAEILAAVADLIGLPGEAAEWRQLHATIAAAYRRRFLGADGLPLARTQTACVLSLHFGLVESSGRAAVAAELVRIIEANQYHVGTGFVGTPYLLKVLEDSGHLDTAYRLLEQETFPSWLFPVGQGATTIWERWDGWHPERGFQSEGMNSFNHYAYGAVGEWMVRSVAGLAPAEPGYRTIAFRPRPGGSIRSARASLELAAGTAAIAWELTDDQQLHVELTVPPGHRAVLDLPGAGPQPFGAGRHRIKHQRVPG